MKSEMTVDFRDMPFFHIVACVYEKLAASRMLQDEYSYSLTTDKINLKSSSLRLSTIFVAENQ